MAKVFRGIGQVAGTVAAISAIVLGPANPVTAIATPPARDFAGALRK